MADPEKPSPEDVTPAESVRAGKAVPRRRGAQAGRMKAGQRLGSRDTALPDPADREKFAAWLATKDRSWSVVIAARAALRVLPLEAGSKDRDRSARLLPLFRATAVSRFAAMYPSREIAVPAHAAAEAAYAAARAARAFYVGARARCAAAGAAAFAAANINAARTAADAVADAADADAPGSTGSDPTGTAPTGTVATAGGHTTTARTTATAVVLRGAITDDLRRLLDSVSPIGIARAPLWPDGGGDQPDLAIPTWGDQSEALSGMGDHWRVWANWYADVVAGRTHGEAWDAAFVDLDPDDPLPWDDGPKAVNERIAARLANLARAEQSKEQPGSEAKSDDSPPEIPRVRPAAIEPVWTDGTLSLAREPLSADLDPDALAGALATLKDELSDLADEAAAYPQLDQRPPAYLREIAGRIPGSAPAQAELFRLGHAKEVLDRFRRTVDAEWPDLLAARYHALLLQFDRTARQFPRWRAFIQNAARASLTPEQIEAVPRLVEPIAAELESPEGQAVVDPAIPQALRDLARPIGSTEQEAEALDAAKDALAVDGGCPGEC
jgi:hypothetical protein